jgi:putative ABC transport system permease protein
MMLLTLAWRNIWRNRRRTIIILTSIVVGVVALIFFDSYVNGFMQQMFESQLGTHTGHLQIHARGFEDDRIVQNFMTESSTPSAALKANPAVKAFSRRTVSYGLISSASNSAGIVLVGIHPDEEAGITTIKASVVTGRYLTDARHEAVIGKRLAETLGVGLGDRIVAMASSMDGSVGSEVFRVAGLFQSPSSAFDKMYVYVPIADAQSMLGVGDRIAEFAILTHDIAAVGTVQDELRHTLGDTFEVLSYRELLPSLIIMIELVRQVMRVFYLIIGLAMLFGIINTMLMSVFERIRELGVLKAIGMRNGRLFRMIVLEAFLLGAVGASAVVTLSLAIQILLGHTGINLSSFSEGLAAFGAGAILYPMATATGVLSAAVVVLIFCVLAAVYPAYRAMRLQPINAIRHV